MTSNVSIDLTIVKSQPPTLEGCNQALLKHARNKLGFFSILTQAIDACFTGLSNDEIKSLVLKLEACSKADLTKGGSHEC